jgi:sec-independent protein translocase protein TatC
MMDDQTQPLTEHLAELRKRIIWVLIFFFIFLVVGFLYAGSIIEWVKKDVPDNISFHIFSPGEAFRIYMGSAFLIAVIFTLPVALWHIWRFVEPGLRPRERQVTLSYIPLAILLFFGGLLFAYKVIFPYVIGFSANLTRELGAQETYGLYDYFRFMFNIVFPIAFLFELPILVMFLTRLSIITPAFLQKARRFAYLALVVFSTLISPPDIVTNILIALPMIVLYEISVVICIWVYRRMQREAEVEMEKNDDSEPSA